jgi:hypothetical protein
MNTLKTTSNLFVALIVRLILVSSLVISFILSANAQTLPTQTLKDVYNQTPVTPQCENPSFESGFAGWTGFRATRAAGLPTRNFVNPSPPLISTSCVPGAGIGDSGSARTCHAIETGGTDINLPSAGHPVTVHGGQSLRLGGRQFVTNKSNGNAIEGVAKRFIVTAKDAVYKFRYSAVLEKAHDGTTVTGSEPYFHAVAIDPVTGAVVSEVFEPASGINPNAVLSTDPPAGSSGGGAEPILYTLWSCSQLDLSSHVGKEVIVYFMNSDCAHGGHTAYSFVDDTCAECKDPKDTGITIQDTSTDLPICKPDQGTNVAGTIDIPAKLNVKNVKVTIEIKQGGTTIKTLTNAVISGSTYSAAISQADLKGLGCYDIVAILEYDVTTPSGNVVKVKKVTNAEGMKPGKDNDICIKDCPPPPQDTGCFSVDPKIQCGKVPGTFVVTLNATGGSSTPDEVEVNVLTAGVTIQNPQSTYLVNSSGQVQLTLVGAAPGSTVELDISGSKLDPKSADGMSICCAGKIKITIPKDLDCVKKVIDVAILKEGKTSPAPTANGYVFNLTATNEGGAYTPAAGSLKITDTVPIGMTFTGVTASAGWSCLPIPPITQGNILTCTYTGGALPAGPGANIGGVQITATANGQGPFPPFKNCAVIGQASTGVIGETTLANNKSCVVVKKPDGKSTVSIEKKCEPVKNSKYPVGPAATAAGYNSNCKITVTTTGPQSGTINVGDGMFGGTAYWMTSTSTPAWTCSGPDCNINGSNLNQTSSVSTFNVVVGFTNAADVAKAKNCAKVVSSVANAESCVPFKIDEGKYTVIKEAFYKNKRLKNLTFPIAVTCGGTTTNATISDGTPYVQTGLPLNTMCSVVEDTTNLPVPGGPAGGCDKGQVGSWTTTYSPTTPVAASVAGGVTTITNRYECKPIDSGIYVKKVVVNNAPGSVAGLVYEIGDQCTGSTQNPGFAYFTDGQNTLFHNYEPGMTCTFYENAMPQTNACGNGMKPVWMTTYAPSQIVTLSPNGTQVTVTNTLNCEKIKEPEVKQIYVTKTVINNAPAPVGPLVFPITMTCTPNTPSANSPMTVGYQDGVTTIYGGALGDTCTVTEGTIPPTNACGKGATPKWTTTFSPAATITVGATNPTITVTNQLDCEDVKVKNLTTFSVRKDATYNGQPITTYNFPMTVTCGNGLAEQIVLTGGQGKTYNNLPDGTTCKVVEGKFDNTGLCPKGTTEQWSKSYVPANGEKTTTTQASVIVTVRNTLECKPIIIIKTPKCDPQTAKLVGKECACTIRGMVLVSTTRCECPKGQRVINGRCGVPPPVCGRAEKLVNGECVVIRPDCQRGERYNAKTNRCDVVRPDCQRGERYNAKTNRCDVVRPDCQRGERYNAKTNRCDVVRPDCQRGERYNAKTNRCDVVRPDCQRGERYNPKRNRCEQVRPDCQRGERYNPKRNRCEEVVEKPRCPRGFIPTELGCINPRKALDIFRDITRDNDKPRGGGGGCKNEDGFPVPC